MSSPSSIKIKQEPLDDYETDIPIKVEPGSPLDHQPFIKTEPEWINIKTEPSLEEPEIAIKTEPSLEEPEIVINPNAQSLIPETNAKTKQSLEKPETSIKPKRRAVWTHPDYSASKRPRFECKECFYSTLSKPELDNHTKMCILYCPACNIEYKTIAEKMAHIRKSHTKNNSIVCPRSPCTNTSNTYSSWVKHIREHGLTVTRQTPAYVPRQPKLSNPTPVANLSQCLHCMSMWPNENALRVHKKEAHNISKCVGCPFEYSSDYMKMDHLRKAHRVKNGFKCPDVDCNQFFATTKEWEMHMQQKSIAPKNNKIRENSVIGWRCPDCSAIYHDQNMFISHRQRAHRKQKCPGCSYMWSNMEERRGHILTMHKQGEMLICSMESCGAELKTMNSWIKHMTMHANALTKGFKPKSQDEETKYTMYFQCPRKGCDFQSRVITLWYEHIDTHKKFECPACLTTMREADKLEHIKENHSSCGWFVCSEKECGKKFKAIDIWKKHVLGHRVKIERVE